jgi:hypothetical protein
VASAAQGSPAQSPPAAAQGAQPAGPQVEQVAQGGASDGRSALSGAFGTASAPQKVCDPGAKWLRVRFDELMLHGSDSVTVAGSEGGRYTLTGKNWTGKAFHTKAFEGDCVTVTAKLAHPDSSYSVDGYQSGEQALAEESVVVAAAGDICGSACNQTDDVVSAMNPAALITAGDNAYDKGTLSQYTKKYDPYWGKFNSIVHPTAGNHEYKTSGAEGYFDYYQSKGVETGPRGKGYYSFDVGDWHMVALNSNISAQAGSTQEKWLRADLAASTKPCTMAYWHHARFSTGDHGDSTRAAALYKALTDYKADVAVVGHDHSYERFAPAMVNGKKDTANGMRQFVIGTGGKSLYSERESTVGPSEVFNMDTFGVGRFELTSTGYSFAFQPVKGREFTDSVSGTCHKKGGGTDPAPETDPVVKVTNVNSGKALDNPGRTTVGAQLVQWDSGDYSNQKFALHRNSDGSYLFKVKNSGLCVGVRSGSTSSGAAVEQQTCTTSSSQKWKAYSSGTGYRLVAVHSGKCLDVANSSLSRGAGIVQDSCDGGTSQQWKVRSAS